MDKLNLEIKIEKLISKGAEANIYLGTFLGYKAVFKKRIPKPYRKSEFDLNLRVRRTLNEAKMLYFARKGGIPVPTLFYFDTKETLIIMEFIEGKLLSHCIKEMTVNTLKELFYKAGEIMAKLHLNSIAHGDFTTSNIINTGKELVIIDFGLSKKTSEIEEQAIDMHLLLRSLESTHYDIVNYVKNSVVEGYEDIIGKGYAQKVYERMLEIRRRGRYVKERRKKVENILYNRE